MLYKSGHIVTEDVAITVTSKNGYNTAEYKIADSRGIIDFEFSANTAEAGIYVSADCEYTSDAKPTMITAVYNNGILVAIGTPGEDQASENINGYLSNGIVVPENTEWTEIKAFVWNNMTTMSNMTSLTTLTNKVK